MPFPPCAEEILPMIFFSSFPGDVHVAVFPTNFAAFSLVSIVGISSRKCLGLNVFRPLRNWISLAVVMLNMVKSLLLNIWFGFVGYIIVKLELSLGLFIVVDLIFVVAASVMVGSSCKSFIIINMFSYFRYFISNIFI